MKKSLSRQFIALLLIPVCIILVINFCIIIHLHKSQNEELKNYCISTLENINVNVSSMTTSMKKTATVFSSQKETQAYLESSSSDSHQLQRQSYSELIGVAQSYTPGLLHTARNRHPLHDVFCTDISYFIFRKLWKIRWQHRHHLQN